LPLEGDLALDLEGKLSLSGFAMRSEPAFEQREKEKEREREGGEGGREGESEREGGLRQRKRRNVKSDTRRAAPFARASRIPVNAPPSLRPPPDTDTRVLAGFLRPETGLAP
jgi:hypothetical protein